MVDMDGVKRKSLLKLTDYAETYVNRSCSVHQQRPCPPAGSIWAFIKHTYVRHTYGETGDPERSNITHS